MENKATKDPMSKKKLLMDAKSNGPYLVQGLGVYPYEAALRGLQLVLFLVVLEYTSSHMHAIWQYEDQANHCQRKNFHNK